MAWCLIPKAAQDLETALKEQGDPEKLRRMESLDRRNWLTKYVGEDNAKEVNALFEKNLLLKNQQKGLESFIKRTLQGPPEIKRDLISRVQKLDKAFTEKEMEQYLQDLASKTVGFDIPEAHMKQLVDLTKKSDELKLKADTEGKFASKDDKLAYGLAQEELETYVNKLKLDAQKISLRQEPLKYATNAIGSVPGLFKSFLSSMDDSFFGRQGIKTLLDVRTSHIWFKTFAKSFVDIGREFKGTDAIKFVKADIYSRPNALNGKYKAGNYGLNVLSEEAFPSSFPSKIPLLGRLYKASESSYNGAALRMRADLADRLIKIAEKQGINTLDKTQAQGMGHLVSSLTGRGSLGKGEVLAKEANVLLFSVKFLKSNFDTLTAHQFDKAATAFTKTEARKNLLSMTASISAILGVATLLDPSSTDLDPRSGNFGKVKVFGRWTDITGGMGSMGTLAARITPTIHNGQWGFWQKNKDGSYTNLTGGKYGSDDALDTFENFFEGKLSPALGIVRDVWRGRTYSGAKPTAENIIKGAITPISFQNWQQMQNDPNASNILASIILEGFGFSSSSPIPTNWNNSTSKELDQFKKEIGQGKFEQANKEFNQKYDEWFSSTSKDSEYKQLSDEGKQSLITKAKNQIKQDIFDNYDFAYDSEQTDQEIEEDDKIDALLPQ